MKTHVGIKCEWEFHIWSIFNHKWTCVHASLDGSSAILSFWLLQLWIQDLVCRDWDIRFIPNCRSHSPFNFVASHNGLQDLSNDNDIEIDILPHSEETVQTEDETIPKVSYMEVPQTESEPVHQRPSQPRPELSHLLPSNTCDGFSK